jgi:hypothetical protein
VQASQTLFGTLARQWAVLRKIEDTIMESSSVFTAYLDRLTALQQDIEKVLTGLPQAGVDWSPGPELNSIGVLVAHVAGSLTYWIGDTVGRGATNRIRSTEFETHAVDAETLRARLVAACADVRSTIAALGEADLAVQHTAPIDGHVVTTAWALAHSLAHAAVHVGHLQVTRHWWEQQASQ